MSNSAEPQVGTTGNDQASLPAAHKPTPVSVPPSSEDPSVLPEWAQALIADLRRENAGHRKAKTEAERLAQQIQESATKEQEHWQELAAQYESKIKRAEMLEQYIADTLATELKGIPERLRGLIPNFDDPLRSLQWVQMAKTAGLFSSPSVPETDSRRGDGSVKSNWESKKERAARLGVDPRYLPD